MVVKTEQYDPTPIFIDATTAPEKKQEAGREKTESILVLSTSNFVFRSNFDFVWLSANDTGVDLLLAIRTPFFSSLAWKTSVLVHGLRGNPNPYN